MLKMNYLINDNLESINFTASSGNIFADLELDNSSELLTRAKLAYTVRKLLESRHLTQAKIASLFDIEQKEVSDLMTGKYHLFEETRLFNFLNKLEQKVVIHITSHQTNEPLIDVVLDS